LDGTDPNVVTRENRWVYVLYSPLSPIENFGYRYCRVDQCGSADDAQTPGNDTAGRVIEVTGGNQTIEDTVQSWVWWGLATENQPVETEVKSRNEDFFRGIELQPSYHPSWTPRLPSTFDRVNRVGANWLCSRQPGLIPDKLLLFWNPSQVKHHPGTTLLRGSKKPGTQV
jgi:hypothetical protein